MTIPADDIKDVINKIKVVPQSEAEKSAFVICGYPVTPPNFPDDVNTFCSKCGMGIVHRPTAPKNPPKICLDCFILWFTSHAAEATVTKKALSDIYTFANNSQAGADTVKKKYGS
jgi:hypothetical protein